MAIALPQTPPMPIGERIELVNFMLPGGRVHTDTEESTDGEEFAVIPGVDRTDLESTDDEHVDYPIQSQIAKTRTM